MTEYHLHTSEEKLKWFGYGEWVEEPDHVEFKYHDIECRIVRICVEESYFKELHMFGGHLCGYVKVPQSHPWYNKKYLQIDTENEVDVHGGLTYGELDEENNNYLPKEGFWIGFDCAHADDYIPSMELNMKRYKSPISDLKEEMKKMYPNCSLFHKSYKNISFCIEQCKSLVDQMMAVIL